MVSAPCSGVRKKGFITVKNLGSERSFAACRELSNRIQTRVPPLVYLALLMLVLALLVYLPTHLLLRAVFG